ncbi:8424_t:CDS:2 [Funneliformis mosseae]|uniref:8424_t:CDS:1 n=1 Tax=Funneliformis mosseae TaxID=27381 RepID=A0A9N8ZKA3_FUNMO|nr:8424_t:CDS:2 [Funneliformis mosseae]
MASSTSPSSSKGKKRSAIDLLSTLVPTIVPAMFLTKKYLCKDITEINVSTSIKAQSTDYLSKIPNGRPLPRFIFGFCKNSIDGSKYFLPLDS